MSGVIVVAGGGGFIGGHLVRSLIDEGRSVRAVDIKPLSEWHQVFAGADNVQIDLRELDGCRRALVGASSVFNLASDMGGMGFIERNRALCMLSVLINTHLLVAARDEKVDRYFFSSSACVYPVTLQTRSEGTRLAEHDAYPAQPEDGYGWEKLYGERLCRTFLEDFGLNTRVARYHNVYGPFGTWRGGREKAPAAVCRKIAEAKLSGRSEIEIWGTGDQTRSFLWIDDCISGTRRLMGSDIADPLNVGSEETVTINELVTLVERIAGVHVDRRYVPSAPQGVMGRSSDNTQIRRRLDWAPTTPLREGLEKTWVWVLEQVERARHLDGGAASVVMGGGMPSEGTTAPAASNITAVATAAPVLSIVVASRNDDHGGDIGRRTRLFINGLLHQTRRFGLDAELIVVEWNPPSEKPRLHEVLPRPSAGDRLSIRCVTVPESFHRRYRHADSIPLYQMIAKNVGIRRARAERVLCANVDLLFSDDLVAFLATGSFDPKAVYRANRCDVPDAIDPSWDVPAQIAYCASHILRRLGHVPRETAPSATEPAPPPPVRSPRYPYITAPPPNPNWRYDTYLRGINLALRAAEYGNDRFNAIVHRALGAAGDPPRRVDPHPERAAQAPPSREELLYEGLDMDACGDFTLMSKQAWQDIQGYAELDLYSIHVDSLALCAAVALGYEQITLPKSACTYHLDHSSGWMSLKGVERLRFLERRPGLDFHTFRDAALEMLRKGGRLNLNSENWGLSGHVLEEHVL